MTGRRRHARFLFAEPLEGNVHIREDVSVEERHGNELVVMCPEPCRPQERLRIEFPGRSRRPLRATVVESRPSVADEGAIRHRLRIVIETPRGRGSGVRKSS
jgi:hypothetical protein